MVLVIFHYQNNSKHNSSLVHLCYLVATFNGSKLQLFQREWEYKWLSDTTQTTGVLSLTDVDPMLAFQPI
jgi:hypothetical protein